MSKRADYIYQCLLCGNEQHSSDGWSGPVIAGNKRYKSLVNRAEAMAAALRDMVKTHSNLDSLEPRHWKQAEQVLAAYEKDIR